MAFGGNCPQCALSHYVCQDLLSSTNYNPDPQLLSKYVIRANVTATKFVCLGKKQATRYLGLTNFVPKQCFLLAGISKIIWEQYYLTAKSIIWIFFTKRQDKIFQQKNIFLGQNVSGQNVTGTFSLMIEPSCRFSPFLGKRS